MNKFQIYSHYKLPINKDPLKYGRLIEQIDNKFIIQLTTKNVAVINQYEKENFVRIFKNGELVLEFKDKFTSDNSFIRYINDTRFYFENDKLISTQILSAAGAITIFNNPLCGFYLSFFTISFPTMWIFALFYLIYPEFSLETSLLISFIPGIRLYSMKGNIIKFRKTRTTHNWETIVININNKLFTRTLLENTINKFWQQIENNFSNNNHMFILFKIIYSNNEISTIGKIQRLNKDDKNWYIDFISENMKFKSEYYNETQINSFIISYGFKSGAITNKENLSKNISFQNYKNHNLPISINPLDYGRIIIQNKTELSVNYIIQNKKGLTIKFNQFEKYNEIEFFKSGISLIKFIDKLINKESFLRKIDNNEFYFENIKQILFLSEIKAKFISKTNKTKNLINNFITLDIETFIKNGELIPYLICFYDGKNVYSFGLWDYDSVELMILDCLKTIFIRKYNGFSIYMHNMAKFDIIFLLKYLVKIVNVHPVIHNGKIICLTINYGKDNKYKIEIKDSYLLLPTSLDKLTKGFEVKTKKSIFPFLFVNENNLDYIGEVPDFSHFANKIKLNEYKIYKSRFRYNWVLKYESIKYCELDCISLYQVGLKFNELIFELFRKNIHHYPTLPSLAFAIFRSNFMTNENIPQLYGKIANDIRKSYTGGAVDMYIPKPPKDAKIKCLDVNSLYPSVMQSMDMPVGTPSYFEGNIRTINPEAFGFFYCEIIAPDDIKHPILQTHVKINNMVRTIAPIGEWEDMIFSKEMDNAIKFGYKFNILWGYTFEKKTIFKDYVDFLYIFRTNYPKTNPLNYIAKILLNSLYGRFGMDDNFNEITVIHEDYIADFEKKFLGQIEDKIELEDYFLILLKPSIDDENNSTHNVSIAVASAITAYARIHMSQFKNNPKINLYYTDTDSIYTDSELDESFIDEKVLGKLKLEQICKEAIFLAPKFYGLVSLENKFSHKVKGLKQEVELTFNDFKKLLEKNSILVKTQTKWKRNLAEAKIKLLEELYTLQVTENKRKLIYKNNKLVGTSAFKIDKTKNIKF